MKSFRLIELKKKKIIQKPAGKAISMLIAMFNKSRIFFVYRQKSQNRISCSNLKGGYVYA